MLTVKIGNENAVPNCYYKYDDSSLKKKSKAYDLHSKELKIKLRYTFINFFS